jgi:predicted amidohydrolase YtcJ
MKEAELIVINADICTMDPLIPRASVLAVTDRRVSALGLAGDIRGLAGRSTRIIDAGGRLMLPGFQDTHIHLQDSGYGYGQSANLDGARTIEELQTSLATFAAGHKGSWVDGVGWYTGIFTDGNLNRHVLDAVVPDRPSFILASDGHNACLNSKACEAVGLETGISFSMRMASPPACCMNWQFSGRRNACRFRPMKILPRVSATDRRCAIAMASPAFLMPRSMSAMRESMGASNGPGN